MMLNASVVTDVLYTRIVTDNSYRNHSKEAVFSKSELKELPLKTLLNQ